MFETPGGCTPTEKWIVAWSQWVRMSHYCLHNDPWCNYRKQEYQGFSFLNKVICYTSMISANVRVLLKRYLQVVIGYSYLPFGKNILQKILKTLKILKIYMKVIQSTRYYPYNIHLFFIFKNHRREWIKHMLPRNKMFQIKYCKPFLKIC